MPCRETDPFCRETDLLSSRSESIRDSLFLTGVLALSMALYVGQLGFYYDDWSVLGYLHTSPDQSFTGLVRTSFVSLPNDANRPLQAPYLAALYRLSGERPLFYHLANALVLAIGIVWFFLALKALRLPRPIAVALPLIYGLLPNYSTDRFWFLASVANLTIPCYFGGLYGQTRALNGCRPYLWHSLGLVALLACGLIYEMFLPLFLLNPWLVWYSARQTGSSHPRRFPFGVFVVNVVAVALIVAFKLATTDRLEGGTSLSTHLYLIYWLFSEAARVNLLQHGFGMPWMCWRAVSLYPDGAVLTVGFVTGVVVWIYMLGVTETSDIRAYGIKRLLRLSALGLLVLLAGYAVFMFNYELSVAPTGAGNRTALAGSVGVAALLVAASVMIASVGRSRAIVRWLFAALLALLSFAGSVLNNTLAPFWIQSYRAQQEILAGAKERIPDLPPDSTLVLDGFCSLIGPAIVFAIDWDATGALMTLYGRQDIRGDVVLPYTQVGKEGISIHHHYPYSRLYVYNHRHKVAMKLTSAKVAEEYFESYSPDFATRCPPFDWGNGVRVF